MYRGSFCVLIMPNFFPQSASSIDSMINDCGGFENLPPTLRQKIQRHRAMYGQLTCTMDLPCEEDTSLEGFRLFHAMLGAFFTFEIDTWESLQDCDEGYVGK